MKLENGWNGGCLFGKLLNSQTFLFDTDLQPLGTLEEEDGGKIMSGNDMAKTTSKQSFCHGRTQDIFQL